MVEAAHAFGIYVFTGEIHAMNSAACEPVSTAPECRFCRDRSTSRWHAIRSHLVPGPALRLGNHGRRYRQRASWERWLPPRKAWHRRVLCNSRKRRSILRRIATLVATSILATHAAAIERLDISQMSCDAVGRTLRSEQKAILRYQSQRVDKMTLYDIWVPDHQSCKPSEAAVSTRLPAADGPCRVFRCAKLGPRMSSRL